MILIVYADLGTHVLLQKMILLEGMLFLFNKSSAFFFFKEWFSQQVFSSDGSNLVILASPG